VQGRRRTNKEENKQSGIRRVLILGVVVCDAGNATTGSQSSDGKGVPVAIERVEA